VKPTFRLQRILELKERKEQAAAARLAEARLAADAARRTENAIVSMREVGVSRRSAAQRAPARIGDLQNISFMIERLEQHLEEVRSAVRKADAQVDACVTDFTEASRERRVLDRLKEKKLEAAFLELADADRKKMDDVALSRFVQSERASEGSGE
jgi:flagellar protein FliJ